MRVTIKHNLTCLATKVNTDWDNCDDGSTIGPTNMEGLTGEAMGRISRRVGCDFSALETTSIDMTRGFGYTWLIEVNGKIKGGLLSWTVRYQAL